MKGVPYCCQRMGGRDKGNIPLRRADFVGTKNCGGEKARPGREFLSPLPLILPLKNCFLN